MAVSLVVAGTLVLAGCSNDPGDQSPTPVPTNEPVATTQTAPTTEAPADDDTETTTAPPELSAEEHDQADVEETLELYTSALNDAFNGDASVEGIYPFSRDTAREEWVTEVMAAEAQGISFSGSTELEVLEVSVGGDTAEAVACADVSAVEAVAENGDSILAEDRLDRTLKDCKHTAISFDLPDRTQIEERLHGVRMVVYLTFTEGYVAATSAQGRPPPVCEEAIWLARQVHELSPDEETTGLLALLLLHHSRASARWDDDHCMLGFDEQDHSLWDTGLIEEATELLGTTGVAEPGPYQVQAAIALLHSRATRGHQPDWLLLTDLYASLYRMTPSPSVAAGYAVALNRTRRSQRALALLEPLLDDPRLARHTGLHIAHAEALTLSGHKDAAAAWQHAADTATDPARRDAVIRRATRAQDS